jgi:hypothetical protein
MRNWCVYVEMIPKRILLAWIYDQLTLGLRFQLLIACFGVIVQDLIIRTHFVDIRLKIE